MQGIKIAASVLAMAAVLASASTSRAEAPANFLVIGTDLSVVPSLDPAVINARTVSEVVSNLYDNLVQLSPDDMKTLKPMLAEKWVVSPDASSITLTLRKGATFSSGAPVTAEDAAWSIRRVIKIGGVGSTDIALFGFTAANVDEMVQATDPQTLVIKLPSKVNTDLVLNSLAGSGIGIIEKTVALEHEVNGDLARGWLKSNAAGSGAFTLNTWRPNDTIITEGRANYWGGAPAMRRVVMRHIPESGNLRLQLEAGDVDVGQYLATGDLEALSKDKSIVIQNTPGFGFYYIALNMKDPDLQKPLVREAFQHLVDWKGQANTTMRFNGFPWQSMIPKGMIGAPADNVGTYDYNPAKAKELLAKAGYPNGLKKKLYPSGAPLLQSTEALQASAKLAGIELELIPGDWVPAYRERKYEVLMGNSGARLADPFGTAVQYAFNPDNRDEAKLGSYYLWRSAFEAPELQPMVEASKTEQDPAKRAAIFARMEETFRTMAPPIVIFFQRTDPYVLRAKVKGYTGHPTWSTRWSQVTKG